MPIFQARANLMIDNQLIVWGWVGELVVTDAVAASVLNGTLVPMAADGSFPDPQPQPTGSGCCGGRR